MSEARDASVREVLADLESAHPASAACLVLRSGALFAGRAPTAVHREVYAAMVATMVGTAETATADLGDEVQTVEARLKGGSLLSAPVGAKLLLVLYAPGPSNPKALSALGSAASRLAPLF